MFAQKAITADEFERMVGQPPYNNGLYELIHNGVVQKVQTEQHGEIAANLVTELTLYKRRIGKGRVGVEVLYGIPGDPNNARQPDVSFVVDADEPTLNVALYRTCPTLPLKFSRRPIPFERCATRRSITSRTAQKWSGLSTPKCKPSKL